MTPNEVAAKARLKAAQDPEGDAIMRALWFDLSGELKAKALGPAPALHRARYAFLTAYIENKSPEDCVRAAREAARIL